MNGTPTEVNYYPGQHLTANLFRTEQAYHVTMRERHNLAGHDWGIALGLQLSAGYVEAGYAWDGYRPATGPASAHFVPAEHDVRRTRRGFPRRIPRLRP